MNWLQQENRLTKTVRFKNQTLLAKFILNIAEIADEMNHHPDYEVRKCSELHISLTTHDANKITEKDYLLAEKVDLELGNWNDVQINN